MVIPETEARRMLGIPLALDLDNDPLTDELFRAANFLSTLSCVQIGKERAYWFKEVMEGSRLLAQGDLPSWRDQS